MNLNTDFHDMLGPLSLHKLQLNPADTPLRRVNSSYNHPN